jgi:hypothetical protein
MRGLDVVAAEIDRRGWRNLSNAKRFTRERLVGLYIVLHSDQNSYRTDHRLWCHYMDTIKRALMSMWGNERGLYLDTGRTACIQRVVDPYHRHHWDCQDSDPPNADHCSLWERTDKREFVFVNQPYHWTDEHQRATEEFCEKYGLTFYVSRHGGWHHPTESGTWLVIYERKERQHEQAEGPRPLLGTSRSSTGA